MQEHILATDDVDGNNLVDKMQVMIDVIPCIPPNEKNVFQSKKYIQLLKRRQIMVEKIPHMKMQACVFQQNITSFIEQFYCL